jgi:UDP-N-acetyl-D-mannosaminuronic acid dehydrogenase
VKAVVIALGKIGLPLAAKIALAGHEVVGCDIDEHVVELVNAGRPPFPNERGLDEALAATVGDGRLRAQTDTTAAVAEGPDLVILVPPLMVDRQAQPDWRILDSVVADVAAGLQPQTLVSLETTVPVGTTRHRVARALGTDRVVFSPERVYSGRVLSDLDAYPKLVGGLSPAAEARGMALYGAFLDAEIRGLGSAEAAELTKLAETTYRDLNIAFANELARHADALHIDVLAVIDAANSQPFSHIHRPGIAVGGHCIPVYPHFFLAGAPDTRLARVAREVNETMPGYAAQLLDPRPGDRVLIAGVAYRGGVKETAYSGAFPLRDALEARGATVLASDPLFTADELAALGFTPDDGGPVDGIVVQADHPEYRMLDPRGARVVVDGRGVVVGLPGDVELRRIGRP